MENTLFYLFVKKNEEPIASSRTEIEEVDALYRELVKLMKLWQSQGSNLLGKGLTNLNQ